VVADVNGQQCDGAMDDVMTVGSLAAKLHAFGARVVEVDGHDIDALAAPAGLPPDGRPLFVLARTDPARGVPLMRERAPNLHYLRFASDEERARYQAAFDAFDEEA
jgi:transketolase